MATDLAERSRAGRAPRDQRMGIGAALVVRGPAGRPRPHRPRHQPARDPGRGRRLDGVVRWGGRPSGGSGGCGRGRGIRRHLLRVRRAAAGFRHVGLAAAEPRLALPRHARRGDRHLSGLAGHGGPGLPGGGRTARSAGALVGAGHDRVRHRRGGAVHREAGDEPAGQGTRRAGRSARHDHRAGERPPDAACAQFGRGRGGGRGHRGRARGRDRRPAGGARRAGRARLRSRSRSND